MIKITGKSSPSKINQRINFAVMIWRRRCLEEYTVIFTIIVNWKNDTPPPPKAKDLLQNQKYSDLINYIFAIKTKKLKCLMHILDAPHFHTTTLVFGSRAIIYICNTWLNLVNVQIRMWKYAIIPCVCIVVLKSPIAENL